MSHRHIVSSDVQVRAVITLANVSIRCVVIALCRHGTHPRKRHSEEDVDEVDKISGGVKFMN